MQDETYLILSLQKYTYKIKYLNTARIKTETRALDNLDNVFKTPSSPLKFIYLKKQRFASNDKKDS